MMKSKMKGLLVLAAVIVLVATYLLISGKKPDQVHINGYLGGEKIDLLEDEDVQDIFRKKYSLTMDYTKAGSIEMMDLGLKDLYGAVTISTTDPVKSNSGNMFAGLLADVFSDQGTASSSNIDKVLPDVQKIAWQSHGFRTGVSASADTEGLSVEGLVPIVRQVIQMPDAAAMEKLTKALEDL